MNKIENIDDCKRIQSTLLGHWNIEASLSECQGIWRHYCIREYGRSSWFSLPTEQLELSEVLETALEQLNWTWDGPYQVFEGKP